MAENTAQQSTPNPGDSPANPELIQPARTFLQHPFVQNVLPFASSFLMHVGIILIGWALIAPIRQITSVIKEQVIIPDAQLVEGAEVGGVPNPGLGTDPNIVSDAKVDVQDQQKQSERASISAGAIGGESSSEGMIGLGSGTASLKMGGAGGTGDGTGSPFGVPGGSGGMGPKSPFMGVSGNAYRIVYLVDSSGSMLVRRYVVIQSLKESIDKLKPVQFFNVVFYHPGGINEIFGKGSLVAATPEGKRQAFDFADGYQPESNGQAEDPSVALRIAIGMKPQPQLIYFLTDGFDRGSDESVKKLRDELKRLNASKEVHVNVIYIADPNQFKQMGGGTDAENRERIITELKAISDDNGGRFRVVEPD